MNKQEEIREGMIAITKNRPLTYQIIRYQHENGVVIKVECPDCTWSQFGDESVGMTPCDRCQSTGYITEPLIEGGT